MDLSQAARALSLGRQAKPRTCPVCGKTFEGVGRIVYCSRRCRAHLYYKRKRARQQAKSATTEPSVTLQTAT
jgi:hypothetical protein